MNDIFISYKREDQGKARKLANALESKGWTVWWDPNLRAGEIFDEVIEKALNEARCVIVMWSKLSVQSEYVKAEATYALEHKKLVPVKIESVDLPFRFRRLHTLSLLGWDGSNDAPGFRRLVEDISAILGPKGTIKRRGQPTNRKQSAPKVQPQKHQSKDIAVSKPETASTDEPQREPDNKAPISDQLKDQALAKFQEELRKQAAFERQIRGVPLPKAPAPPLIGFSLSVTKNARSNDPKLVMEVENKTTEPMYGVEIWVNAVQFWSTAQQVFVSRSDLSRRVLLNTPKILEPDSPVRVFLLTKANKGLLLIADRDTREGGGMWLKNAGMYRLELLIKTANAAETRA
jgi:hypothetical protein